MGMLSKYQIQSYLRTKEKKLHIFLQFTAENLNDYTMFGKIFACSGLRQTETLSLHQPHGIFCVSLNHTF